MASSTTRKLRWSGSRTYSAASCRPGKDVRKAEERAEEIVDEALGLPPARGPALADDED
jgi:hypothetical protein